MTGYSNHMAQGEEKPKVQYRVWEPVIPFLYVIALLFDFFSIIPVFNALSLFVGQAMIAGMFALMKINVLSRKNWIWYVATWIGELIWPISVLPMFMFSVWRIIFISKREDEIKASPLAQAGAAMIAKSQYTRDRMRKDRQLEKGEKKRQELEEPDIRKRNTVANARGSRDVFQNPREQRAEQEKEKADNPSAKSGTWKNISNFADRDPSSRSRRKSGDVNAGVNRQAEPEAEQSGVA